MRGSVSSNSKLKPYAHNWVRPPNSWESLGWTFSRVRRLERVGVESLRNLERFVAFFSGDSLTQVPIFVSRKLLFPLYYFFSSILLATSKSNTSFT